jgi:hypothetical protein
MIDFIHKNAKNSWQWIGLDFSFRLIPFVLIMLLGIYAVPSILDHMYLSQMSLSGWFLLSISIIFILFLSFYSQYKKEQNLKMKLKHHHYKHLASRKHNNTRIAIYKIFISCPITVFLCFVFLPSIFQHFLPLPNIFALLVSSLAFPIEYIFFEGHSSKKFFFLVIASVWILFATYWLKSFLFIMLLSPVLSFSQIYLHKQLNSSKKEKQNN